MHGFPFWHIDGHWLKPGCSGRSRSDGFISQARSCLTTSWGPKKPQVSADGITRFRFGKARDVIPSYPIQIENYSATYLVPKTAFSAIIFGVVFRATIFCRPETIWHLFDWIGLRENLQETIEIFPINMGLSCRFSLKPIHWTIENHHFQWVNQL